MLQFQATSDFGENTYHGVMKLDCCQCLRKFKNINNLLNRQWLLGIVNNKADNSVTQI